MNLKYQTISLLLILVYMGSSVIAPGYGVEADFAPGKIANSIPFDLGSNLIFLPVSVNGSKPLSFILDTGSYSMISTGQAKSTGLEIQLVGTTDGIGDNQQNVYLVTGKTLYGPPGAVLMNQRLLSVPLAQVEDCFNKVTADEPGREEAESRENKTKKRRAIDGILGKEFFNSFVVEIDYKSQIINVYDPATYNYKGTGEHFKIEIAPQHIFVRAKIKAPGRVAVEGRFQVDTGYATEMCLTKEFVDEYRLLPPVEQLKRSPTCGLAGLVKDQSWVGNLERLELGSFRIENPLTEFSQAHFNQEFDGSIGDATLKKFKVIFDYSHREMILEASPRK